MPNSNENEGNERRIRDMLGLVKFCLETTAKEDASGLTSSGIEPMNPDRRAWLEEAMNSMTVDTTRLLLENLALVKETIAQMERDPNYDVTVQRTCNAIEVLTDLCEEIDYAKDFAKLDGFSIFKPLIGCPHEELIVKACELIAALAQNNPLCQTMAMNTRLLEGLVDFVDIKDSQDHIKARSYALYAISSIIRSNQEVRTHFETIIDGLSVLLRLLNYHPLDGLLDTNSSPTKSCCDDMKTSTVYWWRKLRIRSVFLFRTLCSESSYVTQFLFDKEAIRLIAHQLKVSHDPEIREHLLNALEVFLSSLEPFKRQKSVDSCPDLREIIEHINKSSQEGSSDDYDMTDTRSLCKGLLNLIDSFKTK